MSGCAARPCASPTLARRQHAPSEDCTSQSSTCSCNGSPREPRACCASSAPPSPFVTRRGPWYPDCGDRRPVNGRLHGPPWPGWSRLPTVLGGRIGHCRWLNGPPSTERRAFDVGPHMIAPRPKKSHSTRFRSPTAQAGIGLRLWGTAMSCGRALQATVRRLSGPSAQVQPVEGPQCHAGENDAGEDKRGEGPPGKASLDLVLPHRPVDRRQVAEVAHRVHDTG